MNDNPFTECVLKKMCWKQAVNATAASFLRSLLPLNWSFVSDPQSRKKHFPQIIPESRLMFAADWENVVWFRSLSFPVGGAVGIYVASILRDSLLFTLLLLCVVLMDQSITARQQDIVSAPPGEDST